MNQQTDQLKPKGQWKRFFKLLWKARLPYLWILVYLAAHYALIKIGINVTEYLAEMYAGNVEFVAVILPFIAFTLINLVIGTISGILGDLVKARINRSLRRLVWNKIVHLPLSYYGQNHPKELLSRITTDSGSVGEMIMGVILTELTSAMLLFETLKKIGSYSGDLMWSLIMVIPLILAVALVVGKLNFKINHVVRSKVAGLTQNISEKTSNLPLIKSFASEKKEYESGSESMKEIYRANRKAVIIGQLSSPLITIASILQVILIVLIGRGYYSDGTLTLAQWAAYFAFATSISNVLTSQNSVWQNLKSTMGSVHRVANLMEEKEEIRAGGLPSEQMRGTFELSDVTFGYGGDPVFDKFSLKIPEGKVTAVVGESGGGKTTLLNLLERFYGLDSGKITLGGTDINEFSLKEYRDNIAYVTQEVVLFSGTVTDNIKYGLKREVSDEEIVAACRQANALEFIEELENKFDTDVGEMGSRLSGGQKQRIAIVRALLQRPKYLFLDEATASLDMQAKNDVWVGLKNLMANKTTVMVAHDWQTVRHADYVVVLDGGAVADSGTKEELMKRNAFFREMAASAKEVR